MTPRREQTRYAIRGEHLNAPVSVVAHVEAALRVAIQVARAVQGLVVRTRLFRIPDEGLRRFRSVRRAPPDRGIPLPVIRGVRHIDPFSIRRAGKPRPGMRSLLDERTITGSGGVRRAVVVDVVDGGRHKEMQAESS